MPIAVALPHLLAEHEQDIAHIFVMALVLIGLVLVAFLAVSFFRKRLLDVNNEEESGFSLSGLRDLHREGKLSDEEFEKSKAALIAAMKAAAEKAAQRRADAEKEK